MVYCAVPNVRPNIQFSQALDRRSGRSIPAVPCTFMEENGSTARLHGRRNTRISAGDSREKKRHPTGLTSAHHRPCNQLYKLTRISLPYTKDRCRRDHQVWKIGQNEGLWSKRNGERKEEGIKRSGADKISWCCSLFNYMGCLGNRELLNKNTRHS